jgi:hypothetical protein
VKTATYDELRQALLWAVDAKKAADEEYHVFATALGHLLEGDA